MVAILCDGSVEGRCDQVATCDGEDYVNAEALLDDDCDKRLNCSDYKAEEIKCRLCPADSRYGCDGKCYPVKWWGDGECDVFFNCSEAEWDNGVCPR